jgi:hypothetical protein
MLFDCFRGLEEEAYSSSSIWGEYHHIMHTQRLIQPAPMIEYGNERKEQK